MDPFRILMITIGIVFLFKPFIRKLITINNTMRGVQTKITSGTIIFYRIVAIIWILVWLLIPLK